MTVEEALFAYLRAHPGLAALVGSRIYPLKLPQNVTLPAVAYQRISTSWRYALGGSGPRLTQVRFQISCWAEKYETAKAVASQVRGALGNFSGVMGGTSGVRVLATTLAAEADVYEPETGLYNAPVDVLLLHE
jgi:hypothetical protein